MQKDYKISQFINVKINDTTKTVILTKKHLIGDNINKERRKIHTINYRDVLPVIQKKLLPLLDKQYKVIFQNKNKMLLLIYNK